MLDELQLTYTSYNGQNLNSPAVSVIRGSTVLDNLETHILADTVYLCLSYVPCIKKRLFHKNQMIL
jgi:hypothetical protein